MKYFNILFLFALSLSFVSCEDADDKIKRTANTVTIHAGVRFIIYDKEFNPLDSVIVEETRYLPGVTSIQSNPQLVGYSINGIGYKFKNFTVFDNMYFNFEGDRLDWIGSRTINSNFVFEEMKMSKVDSKNIELEFVGNKKTQSFGNSNNYFNIEIEGKISFNER